MPARPFKHDDAIGAYLRDLLVIDPSELEEAPAEVNRSAGMQAPRHALLLEGEEVEAALPLEAFAGVELRQNVPELLVIPVDGLAEPQPGPATGDNRLVIKLRDASIGIACRRADRVVNLDTHCVPRKPGGDRPWLAGIVRGDWAVVIDARALAAAVQHLLPAAEAGTEPASTGLQGLSVTGL